MMQPPSAFPRDTLTAAQVVALLQTAGSNVYEAGLELVDRNFTSVTDVSADLVSGSVTRKALATLHGSASLTVTRDLPWGSAILRPFLIVSDGSTEARFNLGCYFTNTPEKDVTTDDAGEWAAELVDVLDLLNDPIGDVYTLAAGAPYLGTIENILIARGWTAYTIDQAAAGKTLPVGRVWPFDERTTWLAVINDLLASIGYASIWSDWDGRLRVTPYVRPIERAPEWTYTTDPATGMIGRRRRRIHDYGRAPNRWVVYRTGNIEAGEPVEGDGRYTYQNQSIGETSVDARGGRIITKPVGVDAVDQAALVTQALEIIDADMAVPTTYPVDTWANPLHWHWDRVHVEDPALGPPFEALVTAWTLPLGVGAMAQEWSELAT